MSFRELSDRFKRLRNDPVTDVLGTEANRTLEAQAARLYRAHAEGGRAGFNLDLSEAFVNDAPSLYHEGMWTAAWSRVSMELATRAEYQTRLPSLFRLRGRFMPQLPKEDAHGSALGALAGIPFENWRQRAEDNAAVCGILAELAGEVKPKLKGKQDNNERGRPENTVVKEIIDKKLYIIPNGTTEKKHFEKLHKQFAERPGCPLKADDLRRMVNRRLTSK